MLKKRLIFTLLVKEGQFHLSRNFSLQKVGDIQWLFNSYHIESILHSIDELIILNVSNTKTSAKLFLQLVQTLGKKCFMPIAVGGGIRCFDDVKEIFNCGADKVVLNTALFKDFALIHQIASTYGRQSIIASLDFKRVNGSRTFYIENGQTLINTPFIEVIEYINTLPVGELYITAIDRDGTGQGYDLETLHLINKYINYPIIASGGVGTFDHLYEGMQIDKVTGVSTANLFNFVGKGLEMARTTLIEKGTKLAQWKYNNV